MVRPVEHHWQASVFLQLNDVPDDHSDLRPAFPMRLLHVSPGPVGQFSLGFMATCRLPFYLIDFSPNLVLAYFV